MNLESDKRLNIQLRLDFSSVPTGEARQAGWEDIESLSTMSEPERPANTSRIIEEICERANLKEALRQVRGNKGSAGVDRMTVDQLGNYLKQHWPAIREQLLNGTYEPKPVRRRLTPAEPLQHHAHTLTCRHAGEFQIVAGENVPRVLDLQLLATSEEIPFW